MFTILLSITNIICITDIKSGTSSHQSTEEKNDPVYINNRDLFITLANGSTYNLKDAVVTSSNNSNGKQHLVLQDGSEIDVNNTNLEILFNSNDNVKIHNVKNVESRDSNHVFDLENGEQIVVKDAKNVKEEDNGVYNVRTNDNTVMQNSNNEQNSKDGNKSQSKKNKKKKNRSSVTNGTPSLEYCSMLALLLLGNTLYSM